MLRKGYVLLRRVFLFKHFTQISSAKMAGRHRAGPPPRIPARRARPPPQGPSPRGSPKPPPPVIQAACPEARRPGAAGTTGGGASPQPRAADWEVSPEGGGEEWGTPGRGDLGLLIPLKVTDQRRSFRGRSGAGEAGAGPSFPLLCGLGSGAQDPQAASPGEGGSSWAAGEDRGPAGKSAKRPYRAFLELPPPWRLREGCLSPPSTRKAPREQN